MLDSEPARRRVAGDCRHESLVGYADGQSTSGRAIIAVDVFRSTTTLVTARDRGRESYPVATLEQATELATKHPDALLVGELGGFMPYHFDLTNSPAALAAAEETGRPM